MCWLCGPHRPYDGPKEYAVPGSRGYEYAVNGVIYIPNEDADWEELNHYPSWNEVDQDGIRFFDRRGGLK